VYFKLWLFWNKSTSGQEITQGLSFLLKSYRVIWSHWES